MQYDLEVEGQPRRVIVQRAGGGFAVEVAGRRFYVDAVRVDSRTLSLLVSALPSLGDRVTYSSSTGEAASPIAGGRSCLVTVAADGVDRSIAFVGSTAVGVASSRGRRQGEDGPHSGEGGQRMSAPMPGKIVRVLVKKGDEVRVRQPLVVVEAMKMENELRATRDGTVSEVHVEQGASVEAGAPLIDIL